MLLSVSDFFIGATGRFDGNHYVRPLRFIVLILTVIIPIVLIYLMKNKSKKAKRVVIDVIGISVFISEVVNKTVRYINGSTDLFRLLFPTQFSSLVIYMLMLVVVIRTDWYMDIAVLGTLFAGIMYLILPGAGMNDAVIRMSSFNSIYTHAADFIFGVYAIGVGFTSFKNKHLWRYYLLFGVSAVIGIILNIVLSPSSGFYYINSDEFRGIITFMPYEIILVAIAAGYIHMICYIQKILNKKRAAKNQPLVVGDDIQSVIHGAN